MKNKKSAPFRDGFFYAIGFPPQYRRTLFRRAIVRSSRLSCSKKRRTASEASAPTRRYALISVALNPSDKKYNTQSELSAYPLSPFRRIWNRYRIESLQRESPRDSLQRVPRAFLRSLFDFYRHFILADLLTDIRSRSRALLFVYFAGKRLNVKAEYRHPLRCGGSIYPFLSFRIMAHDTVERVPPFLFILEKSYSARADHASVCRAESARILPFVQGKTAVQLESRDGIFLHQRDLPAFGRAVKIKNIFPADTFVSETERNDIDRTRIAQSETAAIRASYHLFYDGAVRHFAIFSPHAFLLSARLALLPVLRPRARFCGTADISFGTARKPQKLLFAAFLHRPLLS